MVCLAAVLTACTATKSPTIETPEVVTETVITLPEETQEPENKKETKEELPTEVVGEEIINTPTEESQTMNDNVDIGNYTDAAFHKPFNDLLTTHVTNDGRVSYTGFKQHWGTLRAYIATLGEHLPTASWTTEDKLAYWMNAYNAMTIDLILRHQPLESIKDIKNPWDQRFWKLGDKYYNLDEIEHKILRKMDEPRIHFGINCASFSCPPLLNEAFVADNVNDQLDTVARKFINDSTRNTITPERLEISEIFNWFSKDFKKNGSLIDYINLYSDTQVVPNAKVRFKDYDWSLNN